MGISLKQFNVTPQKINFRTNMKTIFKTSSHINGLHAYTAKLIPHIPYYFVKKYTQEHNIILDPFCGSGTTLLEARLLKRNAIGIDINPLATLISGVKTTPLDVDKLNHAVLMLKNELKNDSRKVNIEFPNKNYWFSKKAQIGLTKIKCAIESLNSRIAPQYYRFLLLCFSSIIRKASNADSRIAKTFKSKRVIEKIKAGWIPRPIQYFEEALHRNCERIRLLSEFLNSDNYVKIFHGDAREVALILRQNRVKKVDFIITSPPYINAQDYFRSYKLELWWLGLATPEDVNELNRRAIGTENISGYDYNSSPKSEYRSLNIILNKVWKLNKRKSYIIYNYFINMKSIFEELSKILKNGGYFCLITGNNTICSTRIPTYKFLLQIAKNVGFNLVEIKKDRIKNRSLPPKRSNHNGIIKEEWITLFRKGKNTK